jgi:hypothetical protein
VEAVFMMLVMFAFVGLVLSLVAAHIRAKIRHRTEVQKDLIARFTSPQELTDFLSSDAGKRLLHGAKDDVPAPWREASPRPFREQVGIQISWGVLGLCVGAAIFVVYGLTLPSALFIALGVAFEINALLRVLLTKKWHP